MRNKVNRYFFTNFVDSFISLFLTLFLIVSIVFFINIARITSYIELDFSELGKLYSYLLPQIILFTVPISFFVALSISLFRLSKESESIVIFTLGKSPKGLASFFMLLSALLSVFMLFNALFLLPYMEHLNAKFIEYKKSKISLNIRPGELGQKFGDWYVFSSAKSNDGLKYENIVLYNIELNQERLITSPTGGIENEDGSLSLVLSGGNFYDFRSNGINIGKYDKMMISSHTDSQDLANFNIFNYWQRAFSDEKRAKSLSIYSLIALFPLASVLFSFCFGVVVYRYERSGPYTGIFVVLFAYFAGIMLFAASPIFAVPIVFLLCFVSSIFAFNQKILSKF